jgi:hypothetical protein
MRVQVNCGFLSVIYEHNSTNCTKYFTSNETLNLNNTFKKITIVADVSFVRPRSSKRNAYRILVGKPAGKRPLGRLRSRWVDNIKMDLREIGWSGMDWIDLAQDRDQWSSIKCWEVLEWLHNWRLLKKGSAP